MKDIMQTITVSFHPGQQVRIKELEKIRGRVGCVKWDGNKIEYWVSYFWNGELKSVWLLQDQLE